MMAPLLEQLDLLWRAIAFEILIAGARFCFTLGRWTMQLSLWLEQGARSCNRAQTWLALWIFGRRVRRELKHTPWRPL